MAASPYTAQEIESLRREHDAYAARGLDDRVKAVAAELRKAGVEDSAAAPRARRGRPEGEKAQA